MRILMVEDDGYKSKAVIDWLTESFTDWSIEVKTSYRDGCLAALKGNFDFLILDMTLPAWMSSGAFSTDTFVNGGELIIRELIDEGVDFKALILTQYETFNGETLEDIDKRLAGMCGDRFYGCVGYNSQDDSWKINLLNIIKNIFYI